MEEELLKEFKTSFKASLKTYLSGKIKEFNRKKLSESEQRHKLLEAAANFGQHIKGEFPEFRKKFENIIQNPSVIQAKYNIVIDFAVNDVLEEFIDPPDYSHRTSIEDLMD